MTRIYGIANCDKVKAARSWLQQHGISHEFHDFRKDGLDLERVSRWYNECGDALINRRSTTWRNLSETQRTSTNGVDSIALLVEHPTLIQRPVLEADGQVLINFSASDYANFFDQGFLK